MIYNCYIFSRDGKRIYYREYQRTFNCFQSSEEEETKLICGFILSMNSILEKFSLDKEEEHGLRCLQTKNYSFHYLGVASGLKIVINTDLNTHDVQTQLWGLFSLYSNMVVKNPNWEVGEKIEMPEFDEAVDRVLKL